MVDNKVITPSRSHVVSPIVLVPEEEGYRMYVNYKELNKRIHIPHTILPNQDDIRNAVVQGKYVNTCDIKDAYHLIPIQIQDQYKTAFSTPFGIYEFKKLLFGHASAPFIFQAYLTQVLKRYPRKQDNIHVYIDDIFTVHDAYGDALQSHLMFQQYMTANSIPIQDTKPKVRVQRAKVLGLMVDFQTHTTLFNPQLNIWKDCRNFNYHIQIKRNEG